MLHKGLALTLVALGILMGIASTEAAEKGRKKKKPVIEGEYRIPLEKPRRKFWGRDVNRGLFDFARGGKNESIFIWSRGGSKGVFDFRR